jgi:hypothetical protein
LQRDHFSVPSSLLTTALFLSAISSLVAACVLVAIQIGLAKRHRSKGRDAKLRQFAKPRFNTLKRLVATTNEPKTEQNQLAVTGGGATTPLPDDADGWRDRCASLGAAAAMLAPPPKPAPLPGPEDEVELASMQTAMPVSAAMPVPKSIDIDLGSAMPLPIPQKFKARRRSEDVTDEMRSFNSHGRRDAPPTRRKSSKRTKSQTPGDSDVPARQIPGSVKQIWMRNSSGRNSASEERKSETDVRSRRMVGRARGNSLGEDPSACWLTLRSFSSAPGASESGSVRSVRSVRV